MRTLVLSIGCLSFFTFFSLAVNPPVPFGPVPSPRQLQWHDMEMYGLMHFGLNTFTDQEWGFGNEPESLFNPTHFDAQQIVSAYKSAGMKGIILVCKHHDGFCLWPSEFTTRSVKNSPWKKGQGDVVKEIADACRSQKLKFGVYLSPWDRNHKDFGRPEYLTYYQNQLRELLTGYGELFMVWFDGACGGTGYYGGENGKRLIDARTYYPWEAIWKQVRELQPNAVIFSDVGPDVRWVGNENGFATETSWGTLNPIGRFPGCLPDGLSQGDRLGSQWIPPECNVSIRKGWFYHTRDDESAKSLNALIHLYFSSVGRGACFDLNIPPTPEGIIHPTDVKTLEAFGQFISSAFKTNLAHKATLKASNFRGNDIRFSPEKTTDADLNTYWTSDDSVKTPVLVLTFSSPVTFNVIRLREFLPLGQRIESFAIDIYTEKNWKELTNATSIGNQRLIRTKAVTAEKVRLRILQSAACPALSEFGLFAEPNIK